MTPLASPTITQEMRSNALQEEIATEVQKWIEQTKKAESIEIFN